MTYAKVKRGLDILGATLLLVVSTPVWVVTMCALFFFQGRPIFFRQRRIGLYGHPFYLLKFRTMVPGHAQRLPDRPVMKDPHDPRVTPLGGLLRRLEIDELPQLLNILRGEMSLVGPRPLPVEDLEHLGWLTNLPEEERVRRLAWRERRHQLLPGLTGLWQITSNAAEDFDNWVICDLAYLDTCTFRSDLRILCCTPWAILRGRQASVRRMKDTGA